MMKSNIMVISIVIILFFFYSLLYFRNVKESDIRETLTYGTTVRILDYPKDKSNLYTIVYSCFSITGRRTYHLVPKKDYDDGLSEDERFYASVADYTEIEEVFTKNMVVNNDKT